MVSKKLSRFRAASEDSNAWESNEGNCCLVQISQYLLSRIDAHLDSDQEHVKRLMSVGAPEKRRRIASKLIEGFIESCAAAERQLRILESTWHPFLIARTKGDAATYDRIVSRLLSEVVPEGVLNTNPEGARTRILPIMCHKMKTDSAASVFTFNIAEINAFHAKQEQDPAGETDKKGSTELIAGALCIFPSIWSLTTITLLLHEIGHIVWSHCIQPKEQKRLMQSIIKAFPHAFGTADAHMREVADIRLFGEVAADMFAALVGGHAYGTSLCGFFMTKTNHWIETAPGYLDIGDRIGLVRKACEHIAPDCPGRGDTYWSAIEGLKKHLDESVSSATSEKVHLQKADNRTIGNVIRAFEKCLRALGVELADAVAPLPVERLTEGPATTGKTIRDSLALAAKYRNDCADDDGTDYIEWETKALSNL